MKACRDLANEARNDGVDIIYKQKYMYIYIIIYICAICIIGCSNPLMQQLVLHVFFRLPSLTAGYVVHR